ncbi:MAG: tyrosine-type recombinase/integrase [Bacteroidota bacterium]
MGYIEDISDKIAKLIIQQGLDYNQTKVVFKMARQKAGLKPEKKIAGAVERLSLEEELAFIKQAYQESGRTGLMMQTLLETGCRVSEFIELRVEDVSFEERLITIHKGKGGRRREVPIREDLAKQLKIHIANRKAGSLFKSRQKPYKYTRQRIGQIVRDIAQKANIRKRIYPHLLRHTVATKLLNMGMDIAQVQKFLGHQDIATTQLYAVMQTATLRKKFDAITAQSVRDLLYQMDTDYT